MNSGYMNRDRSRSPIGSRNNEFKKVLVSNIHFDYKQHELEELFMKEVGDVTFLKIYTDKKGKSLGIGTVEFDKAEATQKAINKMHLFNINGRKLVVKREDNVEIDKSGRPITNRSRIIESGSNVENNTYGLSPEFLKLLNIRCPLIDRIFVKNLHFKVDEAKLNEVFKLAGRVLEVKIFKDKLGKSKGYGLVKYNHPVEAVQAISMFNNQVLFDCRMSVWFDRMKDPFAKLPEGLKSTGMGLGPNGKPLHDIERKLQSNYTS
ncbi:Hypothetical protein CINCED_3A024654 [Cinara cedri]|uniref:RRM domain-containing protein n=1 Tax=Cinara cedri TaxID=506608 RepID=A0A5E4NQZ8_9HEMI|nr:Hypothetical protein CINCED_3A024654 [Cinara cedri]